MLLFSDKIIKVRLYGQRVCKCHLFSDNARSPSKILHQSVVPARDCDFVTSSVAMGVFMVIYFHIPLLVVVEHLVTGLFTVCTSC